MALTHFTDRYICIDNVFENAITTVNLLSSRTKHQALPRPPSELRATLYGLYKQATEGDVVDLLARPVGVSAEDLDAQSKWDIWNNYKGILSEYAKREYINKLIESMKVSRVNESTDRSTIELLNQLEDMYLSIKYIRVEKFNRNSMVSASNNLTDSQSILLSNVRKTETQIITSFDESDSDPINSQRFHGDKLDSPTNHEVEPKTVIPNVAVNNSRMANKDLNKELQLLQQRFSAEISHLNKEVQILKASKRISNNYNDNANQYPFRGYTEDLSFSTTNGMVVRRNNNMSGLRQSFQDFDNQSAISSSTYRYKILKPGGASQIKKLPYLKEITSARIVSQPISADKSHEDGTYHNKIRRFLHSAEDLTLSLCRKISLNFGMNLQLPSNNYTRQSKYSIFASITCIFEKCCKALEKYNYILKYFGKSLTKVLKQLAFNVILAIFVLKITNKRIRLVKREKQTVISLENGDVLDLLKEKLLDYLH